MTTEDRQIVEALLTRDNACEVQSKRNRALPGITIYILFINNIVVINNSGNTLPRAPWSRSFNWLNRVARPILQIIISTSTKVQQNVIAMLTYLRNIKENI